MSMIFIGHYLVQPIKMTSFRIVPCRTDPTVTYNVDISKSVTRNKGFVLFAGFMKHCALLKLDFPSRVQATNAGNK